MEKFELLIGRSDIRQNQKLKKLANERKFTRKWSGRIPTAKSEYNNQLRKENLRSKIIEKNIDVIKGLYYNPKSKFAYKQFFQIINKLHNRIFRQILTLEFYEGLSSQSEIAERLNISQKSVSRARKRALSTLRNVLRREKLAYTNFSLGSPISCNKDCKVQENYPELQAPVTNNVIINDDYVIPSSLPILKPDRTAVEGHRWYKEVKIVPPTQKKLHETEWVKEIHPPANYYRSWFKKNFLCRGIKLTRDQKINIAKRRTVGAM